MRRNKTIVVTLLFLMYFSEASSQNKLQFKYYRYDTGIAFRWYPADQATWIELNKNKLQVKRFNLTEDPNKNHPVTLFPQGIGLDTTQLTNDFKAANPAADILLECLKTHPELSPIDAMKASNECMLYSMLLLQTDFRLTLYFGLGFMDMSANPNAIYLYRFYSEDGSDSLETLVPFSSENIPLPAPILTEKDNAIICKIPRNSLPEYCSGFIIETSLDSGISWNVITEKPILKDVYISDFPTDIYYSHKIDIENAILRYRLRPINYFGDTLFPGEFSSINISSKFKEYPKNITLNQNCLRWDFSEKSKPFIKGFTLCFASDPDASPKEIIMNNILPNSQEYCLSPNEPSGYYSICCDYLNGAKTYSAPVLYQAIDSISPLPIHVISSTIDSLGKVSIAWKKNSEKDIYGYQVYRSNFRIAEYSNISHTWQQDTVFFDTLNIGWLRDSVFYYIVSADERYNESLPSEIVALSIPDTSKPDVPIILSHGLHADTICFYGFGPSGKNIDYLELYRSQSEGTYLLCSTIKVQSDSFVILDPFSAEGNNYTYKIRAKSLNKKYSDYSPPYAIEIPKSPLLPAVKGVHTWIDSATQKLYIQWQKPQYPVSHFRILNNKNGNMETVSTQKGDIYEIVMPWSDSKKLIQWKIIAYDDEGRRSAW